MTEQAPESTWQRRTFAWLAGIFLLCASGALAYYYFTVDENKLAVIETTRHNVYDTVNATWLSPKPLAALNSLHAGETDDLEYLLLRTALGRWRLRDVAPHAFDNLLDDLRKGYWPDEVADSLPAVMKRIDSRWRDARRVAIRLGKTAEAKQMDKFQNQGFDILLKDGTHSAEIGSLIEVTYSSPRRMGQLPPVYVYWQNAVNPGIKPTQVRLVDTTTDVRTSGSVLLYQMRMDFSDSPIWLDPATRPTILHVRCDTDVDWTPVSIKTGDSNLLPVTETAPAEDSAGR